MRNNLSCFLQNGHAFIFLREIINFWGTVIPFSSRNPEHDANDASVFDQHSQCLCGKKKGPWENVITRSHSWIHQPPVKNGPTDGFMDKAGAEWSRF